MFKFLFGRARLYPFAVYYTYSPGTFVLREEVVASSEYEANRLFDLKHANDTRCRRLEFATIRVTK